MEANLKDIEEKYSEKEEGRKSKSEKEAAEMKGKLEELVQM